MFFQQKECFTELRIFKGLGYTVHCISTVRKDSGDFSVVVESVKFHPNYVIDSIHDFLKNMYHQLSKIISPSFLQALSSITSPKGKTSQEFWEDVKNNDFKSATSRKIDIAKVAGKINFDEYKKLFHKYFITESTRRMLTIVAYGKGKPTKLKVDCNISSDKIDQTKLDLDHACI